MKIRESWLQKGIFIYKMRILVTKQEFHLQNGSFGIQTGFSAYYLPSVPGVFFKIPLKRYEFIEKR